MSTAPEDPDAEVTRNPWRNADRIEFQSLWHGSDYQLPHARIVPPDPQRGDGRPYIALEIAGTRVAFWSSVDARRVVVALAEAVEHLEELEDDAMTGRVRRHEHRAGEECSC
jgi:hypothetical protein